MSGRPAHSSHDSEQTETLTITTDETIFYPKALEPRGVKIQQANALFWSSPLKLKTALFAGEAVIGESLFRSCGGTTSKI